MDDLNPRLSAHGLPRAGGVPSVPARRGGGAGGNRGGDSRGGRAAVSGRPGAGDRFFLPTGQAAEGAAAQGGAAGRRGGSDQACPPGGDAEDPDPAGGGTAHQLPHQQGMAGVGGICDLPPAGAVPGAASPGAAPRAGAYQAGAPLVQGVGQHGGISLLVGPADLAGLQIFLSGPGAGMRRGCSEGAGAGGTAGVRQDPGGDGGRAEPVEHAIVLRGVRYSGAGQDSGPPAANRGSPGGASPG